MLANTKQVRKILRIFNISANYTEKTNKRNPQVRVVMGYATRAQYLEIKQAFADLDYTNKVYFTSNMYLRVKTFLA